MNYYKIVTGFCLIFLFRISYAQNSDSSNEFQINTSKYCSSVLGENVFLFNPGMDMTEIQNVINELNIRQTSRGSEFNTNRYALLFEPGKYNLDVQVGYYMQIMGLGESPEDIVITGAVRSKSNNGRNVLTSFWREAENLTVIPTIDPANIWAVSQASALRRVYIKGNLQLHDNSYASGGFMADSKIDGNVSSGPQQQWLSRNSDWKEWSGGVWNMMFIGVPTSPSGIWPKKPFTVIDKTPIIREKPYLVLKDNQFYLKVPDLKKNSAGPGWLNGAKDENSISLDKFYIAKPSDNAKSINSALKKGKNLLFTPGIYNLEKSIKVTKPGTIIIGIGMPTLIPTNGNLALEISDIDNITIGGLIIDAGKVHSEALLQFGKPGSGKDHQSTPSFLYDMFFRVGGSAEGSVTSCMIINSNNVCIDHTWIWRADHGKGVGWNKNKSANGLIVNGDDVTIYGLFNEHFQEYQTLWNGNNGKVYFYQSELPYDPVSVNDWKHNGVNGYASYKVSDQVKSHEAWGIGIYSNFTAAPIIEDNAIETPPDIEKTMHHKVNFWLNGNTESVVKSIINGKGNSVNKSNRKATLD